MSSNALYKAVIVVAIPQLANEAVKLAVSLREECDRLIPAIKQALAEVDALKKCENKARRQIKKVIEDLMGAVHNFYLLVDSVNDVFSYGRDADRMTRVKEGIRRGDYRELLDFTEQLTRYLAAAEGCYKETKKAFEEVQRSSLNGEMHCRMKVLYAQSKGRNTRAVNTTAAYAGTALGIAASVAAGVFTGGFGAVVGLVFTAACVGACRVATHIISSDYQELEEKFRYPSVSFKEVYSSASTMLDDILSMKVALVAISSNVDTVMRVTENHRLDSYLELVTAWLRRIFPWPRNVAPLIEVNRLYERFDAGHNQSSQCQAALKEIHDQFRDK